MNILFFFLIKSSILQKVETVGGERVYLGSLSIRSPSWQKGMVPEAEAGELQSGSRERRIAGFSLLSPFIYAYGCLWRPGEVVRSPGAGDTDSCELPCE